jgi:predicted ester cyclase
MHVTVEDSLAEGDKVFTRGYFTGTHTGAFQGIPPTGKKINAKYMDEWLIKNGKATDNWVRIDMLSIMQQLGVVPQSPPPQH